MTVAAASAHQRMCRHKYMPIPRAPISAITHPVARDRSLPSTSQRPASSRICPAPYSASTTLGGGEGWTTWNACHRNQRMGVRADERHQDGGRDQCCPQVPATCGPFELWQVVAALVQPSPDQGMLIQPHAARSVVRRASNAAIAPSHRPSEHRVRYPTGRYDGRAAAASRYTPANHSNCDRKRPLRAPALSRGTPVARRSTRLAYTTGPANDLPRARR